MHFSYSHPMWKHIDNNHKWRKPNLCQEAFVKLEQSNLEFLKCDDRMVKSNFTCSKSLHVLIFNQSKNIWSFKSRMLQIYHDNHRIKIYKLKNLYQKSPKRTISTKNSNRYGATCCKTCLLVTFKGYESTHHKNYRN